MRVIVRHETIYTYRTPMRYAVQILRLTPRSSEQQFVRHWRVRVDADARLDRGEDAFGNITHMAFIDGPVERLRIFVEGEVDTTDAGGHVGGYAERQPALLFLRDTLLTHSTPDIRRLAQHAMAAEGGDLLASLHHLNEALFRTMTFKIGATTAMTTAAQSFEMKAGVCQDFAHIFIAAARSLSIPARYVSGYYLRTDLIEQEAGHAWAEAYIAGIGWIAFDPAQGMCTTDRYVRVAIGADSNDASSIRGARTGGLDETLSVMITVAPGATLANTLEVTGNSTWTANLRGQAQTQS